MKDQVVQLNPLVDTLNESLPNVKKTEYKTIFSVIGAIVILIIIVLLVKEILPSEVEKAANVGHYINVAGCGTNVGGLPGCALEARCDIAAGTCTTQGGEYMFLWQCDGEVPDCRETQVLYNHTGTLGVNDNASCQGSVQIDVFNHNCRPSGDPYGSWSCGDTDLIDYITWYWDSCDPDISPTPTPLVTPEITPALCEVDKIDLQFRIECPSTDLEDNLCGDTITGATPIDDVWYQGSDISLYVNSSNYVEILDVRCVLDPTTTPVTLFDDGYLQISIDNSPNPDTTIGYYPVNATNTDWLDIYDTYGDNTYKFRCVLAP